MSIVKKIVSRFELTVEKNPLLILNLLLTYSQANTDPKELLKLGHHIFYDLDYVPKVEKLPNGFANYILELKRTCIDPLTLSYFNGFAGISCEYSSKSLLSWRSSIINSRLLRIFHNDTTMHNNIIRAEEKTKRSFICIVGPKGSGKSTLLNQFANNGHKVVEVYKDLFARGLEKKLPHPKHWCTQPLEMVLSDISANDHYVFIGSLLRQEEFTLLSQIGNVHVIEIATKNILRYNRLLERGRKIENNLNQLLSLDLNRFGFRTGYETNDLGFWLSKAENVILNNTDGSKLYETICQKLKLGSYSPLS